MSYEIARDGEKVGAFSEEELIEAVENGTVLITDMAWTEGMDEWEPVETLIEIEDLEEPPAPEPAAPPATASAGPMLRPLGQHRTPAAPAAQRTLAPLAAPPRAAAPLAPRPPQRVPGAAYASIPPGYYGPAGSAIASLVLGILSLFTTCLTGVPAILCGHAALSKIRRTSGAFSGRGMAVAGMVLGYVMTTLSILLIAGYFLIVNIRSKLQEQFNDRSTQDVRPYSPTE